MITCFDSSVSFCFTCCDGSSGWCKVWTGVAVQMHSDSDCGVTISRTCCFHLSICFAELLMTWAGGVCARLVHTEGCGSASPALNDWNNIQMSLGGKPDIRIKLFMWLLYAFISQMWHVLWSHRLDLKRECLHCFETGGRIKQHQQTSMKDAFRQFVTVHSLQL